MIKKKNLDTRLRMTSWKMTIKLKLRSRTTNYVKIRMIYSSSRMTNKKKPSKMLAKKTKTWTKMSRTPLTRTIMT